ncbi:uncharacterized protein LOC104427124 [Eucalyptus grandis]|uniref:uncharacterized protein LOC104427124 n=1 Tax=Eucalyptus grandis TaxID=71139 RepID=UPI00192EA0E4|nr:uncharacterized protein LOC104427124 [Eucalyptus grandis]
MVPKLELLIVDLAAKIQKKNIKLFAMTDSRSGNVIHLAAYTNQTEVFELLPPETEYLARAQDMNGDLPIYIVSKIGYVELIEKLYPISEFLNGRGQTVLHAAAKYGQASAVKYILRHPELQMLISDRYYAGNTALHLAAIHSQPVALIPLVLDKRINLFVRKHECLTALDIAQYRIRREYTLRKQLTVTVLKSTSFGKGSALVSQFLKDLTARTWPPKMTRGMATMLDKKMFQAFVICSTIAMFCSMIAAVNLICAQQNNVYMAIAAYQHTILSLKIAIPVMCQIVKSTLQSFGAIVVLSVV